MKLEVHIIQNFSPSNLNRDDTGAPKECEFGGYRRARISSQCIKRAIREEFRQQHLLGDSRRATRTKRLRDELAKRLERSGRPAVEATGVATAVIQGLGLGFDSKDPSKTEYLLFLAASEIERLTGLCQDNWDSLVELGRSSEGSEPGRSRGKKAGKQSLTPELQKQLKASLDGGRASDIALFGRMLADLPEKNIDAASQVAHAISTNRVSMEFDFFTAVDDLRPEETEGADMLGTVQFNSSCFYRYANVDLEQLGKNLGHDDELAGETTRAFLQAAIDAVPTGKQNSMAAQNPPSLIFAVLRDRRLWSLANAFVEPARPAHGRDLVAESIDKLDRYWGSLVELYGDDGITGAWVASLDGGELSHLGENRVGSVPELISRVMEVARFDAVDVVGSGQL